MKAFHLTLVLLLTCSALFAQKRKNNIPDPDKSYKYAITSNDPESAPNLNIVVNPFYITGYSLNLNMGYSFEASYRLNNKIGLSGFYGKSYLDRFNKTNGNSSTYHGFADEEQLGVTNYGFGGVFYFRSELQDVTEDVTIKQTNNGSVTTRYIIQVPSKRLQLFGLRASYEVFDSPVYSKNNKIAWKGYPSPDSTGNVKEFSDGQFSTMMYSSMLNIGVCRTRIADLYVKVEDFGNKQTTYVSEVYADLSIATKITFADMLVTYQSWNWSGGAFYDQYQPYVVNDNTVRSKIGFRVGWTTYVNDGFTALSKVCIEAGMKPGPKAGSDNLYILARFGLNFAAKVGVKGHTVQDI